MSNSPSGVFNGLAEVASNEKSVPSVSVSHSGSCTSRFRRESTRTTAPCHVRTFIEPISDRPRFHHRKAVDRL